MATGWGRPDRRASRCRCHRTRRPARARAPAPTVRRGGRLRSTRSRHVVCRTRRRGALGVVLGMSPLAVVCVLTFLHYVGAQMRGPVLPLYAAAQGATATGVGTIVAAHMLAA